MATKRKRKPTDPQTPAGIERRILTLEEAANYLGVTPRWMVAAKNERRIPVTKMGKLVRFHIDDLDAYIASRRVPAER